jgi:hypothetical protein
MTEFLPSVNQENAAPLATGASGQKAVKGVPAAPRRT